MSFRYAFSPPSLRLRRGRPNPVFRTLIQIDSGQKHAGMTESCKDRFQFIDSKVDMRAISPNLVFSSQPDEKIVFSSLTPKRVFSMLINQFWVGKVNRLRKGIDEKENFF
jgi:hypothetical protein